MKTTTWPPGEFTYLEPATDPKYSVEPSWFDGVQFEYHLVLILAAIICLLAVAKLLWPKKN